MPSTSEGIDNSDPSLSIIMEGSPGRFIQRDESLGSHASTPTSQPSAGISVISDQRLPTYRQASMSEGGVSPSGYPSTCSDSPSYLMGSSLPDILYSHVMPRVPPLRPSQHRQQRHRSRQESSSSNGNRHRHRREGNRPSRHRRPSSWSRSPSSTQTAQEGSCKEPCVKCVVTITSFKWVLVALSVLGVFCVVTGIVLAALHAAGDSFLFLAIMFIGLGVLLVIVVGIGWKCTPRGHEPLHALFGIGSFRHGHLRGRRHRRHRNRDGNWFGGVLYPEFQHRLPPPTYAASMLDYQNQAMSPETPTSDNRDPTQRNGESLPNSPPPSYRSRTSTGHSRIIGAFSDIHDSDDPQSRPPTYRSRAPSRRPSLPREYFIELGVSEMELAGVCSPQNSETSNIHISHDGTQTAGNTPPTSSSSSSSPPHHPTSGPLATESCSGNTKHPTSSVITSQVYSVPFERSILTDNQTSSVLTQSQNLTSSSSQHHPQTFPSTSKASSGIQIFHQRMPSEDRNILEQTLQTLEEQLNESGGIVNEGASLDE